jgi:hypothetical protein
MNSFPPVVTSVNDNVDLVFRQKRMDRQRQFIVGESASVEQLHRGIAKTLPSQRNLIWNETRIVDASDNVARAKMGQ